MKRIYFAGPLFTWGEREQNRRITEELRALGYHVFLPQEIEQKETTANDIFNGDIAGIGKADVVVACMDGPDPDSGTCFEVGHSYQQKPIIVYHTDIRQETPFGPYNLMLHQAADMVLKCEWMEPAKIALMIHEAIEDL